MRHGQQPAVLIILLASRAGRPGYMHDDATKFIIVCMFKITIFLESRARAERGVYLAVCRDLRTKFRSRSKNIYSNDDEPCGRHRVRLALRGSKQL
eukprot:SAG31_NODE_1961_length_6802_cov_3.762047_1_plen_96_part_00